METILFDAIKEAHKQIQKYIGFLYIVTFLFFYCVNTGAKTTVEIAGFSTDTFLIGALAFIGYWVCYFIIISLTRNLTFLLGELKNKDPYLHKVAKQYPSLIGINGFMSVVIILAPSFMLVMSTMQFFQNAFGINMEQNGIYLLITVVIAFIPAVILGNVLGKFDDEEKSTESK